MKTNNIDMLLVNGATLAPLSLAASANLQAIHLAYIYTAAIQLVYTGTPAGAFKLQVSLDVGTPQNPIEGNQQTGITHWTDVTDSSTTISAAGSTVWTLQDTGANWVRVVWTASGAGTTPLLTSARMVVKGF